MRSGPIADHPAEEFAGQRRRPTEILLFSAVAIWMALIFLAPYLRASDSLWADWIYGFFHQACHQIPERSFAMWGEALAVCHRCLGLYSGFTAGLILLPGWRFLSGLLQRRPRWVLLFFAPMMLDVMLPNTPASRYFTGFVAAFPVAYFVKLALLQLAAKPAQAVGPSRPAPKKM